MINGFIQSAEWMNQTVPLYAFLAALLTDPTQWSRRASAALRDRLGTAETDGGNDV